MRLLLLGLAGLIPAFAAAAPVEFDIPAEPVDRAVLDFSRQAGTPVLLSYEAARQIRSPGVHGSLEPADALNRLLQGTPFLAERNAWGAFVIIRIVRPASAPPAAAPAPPPPAAPASDQGQTTLLGPFVVKGYTDAGMNRTLASTVAIGDLDLERTENDPLPYMIFSGERIAQSGVVDLDDFLREQVLESDAATPPPDEQGGGSAFLGGTSLNLRAYGSDETLVLVNGLPMPQMLSGGITNGTTNTTRQPDVDLIPQVLIDRVEVLPVSAAALYSGTPVGGVINIVLRPIEDLTQVTSTYSNGRRVDAPQSSVSLLHGQTLLDGRLAIRLDATFTRTVPATEQELGYIRANLAAHPDIDFPASYPPPLDRATPNIASLSGAPLFGPGTSNVTSVAPGSDGSGGLAPYQARDGVPSLALFQGPGGDADSPDSVDYAYGRRQATQSYFGSATYNVFPRVQVGFDGSYSRTQINPGYDVFSPPGPDGLVLSAASPFNPFGQDVAVQLDETPRLGEDYEEANVELYSALAALLVRLPHGWRLSGDAQYSHTFTHYRGLAGVDPVQWQDLVDAGQYDPLRDTQAYGPPPAFYDQALLYFGGPGRFVTLDNYQSLDLAARLIHSKLQFPTGTGAVMLGTDYSIDQLASFDDLQTYGNGAVADTSGVWQGRTLQQVSVAAEAQAPLLPSAWLPPWLRGLSADAAARYNISDTTYGSNLAPTAGLKLDLAGGFSLRASISHTNRFPTPSMSRFIPLPGGIGSGIGQAPSTFQITDPDRGNETYDVSAADTPEAAYRPEADVTRSAGIVFQRGKVQRIRLSVDYFDTFKSGEVDYLDAQDVITYEAYLPGRVTRAAPAPGDPYGVGPATFVLTGDINSAWRHSRDFNTDLDYAWTKCAGGTLQVYARWLHFVQWERQLLPNTPVVDELRLPDTSSLDLIPDRLNFGVGWTSRRIGFGFDGQYFSPRKLPQPLWTDQGSEEIGSFFPIGAFVKGDLTRLMPWKPSRFGLTGQLRIDNVFSASLPKFPDNPDGTGVEPYGDWRGQVYSLSLTASY